MAYRRSARRPLPSPARSLGSLLLAALVGWLTMVLALPLLGIAAGTAGFAIAWAGAVISAPFWLVGMLVVGGPLWLMAHLMSWNGPRIAAATGAVVVGTLSPLIFVIALGGPDRIVGAAEITIAAVFGAGGTVSGALAGMVLWQAAYSQDV